MEEQLNLLPTGPERDGEPAREDASRVAYIASWAKKVQSAERYFKWAFDRMRWCQDVAAEGCDKKWSNFEGDDPINSPYTVPLSVRHINQTVAKLYAKNPKPYVMRKEKLDFVHWDETEDSLNRYMQTMVQAQQLQPLLATGDEEALLLAEQMAPAMQEAQIVLAEIEEVRQHRRRMDKMARTLELFYEHHQGEQLNSYKGQLKQLVRRTKVNGVGYIKLGFQREFKMNPDVTARIQDHTNQLTFIQAGLAAAERKDEGYDEGSAKVEELKKAIETLQADEKVIGREGVVWGFPASTTVIVSPSTTQLSTLTGTRWIAVKDVTKTPEDVERVYGVDVKKEFTAYKGGDADKESQGNVCLYQIQDKDTGMVFTIAEGYHDYIEEPKAPDVRIERFFDVFPLVFNGIEHEKRIFPPSDIWLIRHPQAEINRSKEALREHRQAARPYTVMRGDAQLDDEEALENRDAHDIIKVNVSPGEKIGDVMASGPTSPIDPNLYETSTHQDDIFKSVGSNETQFGGLSGATATEASIADDVQSAAIADNVDDLNDFLSDVAKSTGQLMFLELSEETVKEVVGPGAVWPQAALTRDEVAKDLMLSIKAGSTGRPNKAADAQKLERAMPTLVQVPGLNPKPLVRRYSDHLDIDFDEIFVEGLPSIQAINAAAGAAQPSTGDPATDPNAQGGQGGQNAPAPDGTTPGGQPEFNVGPVV